MAIGVLGAMGYQLWHGYSNLEPLLYLQAGFIDAWPFVLMGVLALFLHVVSNHKFIGYLLLILVLLSQIVLSQIGYEGQINNTAAGDLSDAIGLRGYARKGGVLFFNFDTGQPIYCFARNCWAAAMCEEIADDFPQHRGVIGSGYCSADHFRFVEPGRARRWFQEGTGFDFNATTSKNAMR